MSVLEFRLRVTGFVYGYIQDYAGQGRVRFGV